jgi:hypothetical protein
MDRFAHAPFMPSDTEGYGVAAQKPVALSGSGSGAAGSVWDVYGGHEGLVAGRPLFC